MKDTLAYVFDGNQFTTVSKGELLNDLIDVHANEIFMSLNKHKKKLKPETVTCVENFIQKLNDTEEFVDQNNKKTYENYKAYKMNALKMIIYNNSNKDKLNKLKNSDLVEKIHEYSDDDC